MDYTLLHIICLCLMYLFFSVPMLPKCDFQGAEPMLHMSEVLGTCQRYQIFDSVVKS
jgi:hypothetical protein